MIRLSALILALSLPAGLGVAQPASDDKMPPPEWLSFDEAVGRAAQNEKSVLVDIYATWCGWCAKLQDEVYTVKGVRDYLDAHFEIARLNIEEYGDTLQFKGYTLSSAELAVGLGAEATPTTVFLTSKGEYITRLPGFVDADGFLQVLEYIGSEAFKTKSYEEFLNAN